MMMFVSLSHFRACSGCARGVVCGVGVGGKGLMVMHTGPQIRHPP